jgi:tetratricopeptide (TPR) repeat protein
MIIYRGLSKKIRCLLTDVDRFRQLVNMDALTAAQDLVSLLEDEIYSVLRSCAHLAFIGQQLNECDAWQAEAFFQTLSGPQSMHACMVGHVVPIFEKSLFDFHKKTGMLHLSKGDTNEALKCFEQALRINADDQSIHHVLNEMAEAETLFGKIM